MTKLKVAFRNFANAPKKRRPDKTERIKLGRRDFKSTQHYNTLHGRAQGPNAIYTGFKLTFSRRRLAIGYRRFVICRFHVQGQHHEAEFSLRSLPVFSQSRNSPHFMEPEGSLPRLQEPATCPYLSQINPTHFLQNQLNITLPSTPRSVPFSIAQFVPKDQSRSEEQVSAS